MDCVKRMKVLESHVSVGGSSEDNTELCTASWGEKPNVTVCGGGNAAHVMAADLTLKGYSVNIYAPFADEADRFNKALASNPKGLQINYVLQHRTEFARPNKVSKHAEEVIPGSKLIFIPLPVFAHEGTLRDIVPLCDRDACIVALPATGCFDWSASKVFKELGKSVTIAGVAPLPYVCRIARYGEEVNLNGIKEQVGMAAYPGKAIDAITPAIEAAVGFKVVKYPTFLPITLTPTNPIMHTARMYGMLVAGPRGYWRECPGFRHNVKFYDECDDASNEWLHKLDEENQAIARACEEAIPGSIGGKVQPINKYLKWAYTDDITKWDTAGDCFRSNKQFHGIGSPMIKVAHGYWVPDFKSRYFTEDFPFGLLANRGLAELLHVRTPAMDIVIEWAQFEMGKQWLIDHKINPSELPQMTPQAFGLTLEDIKEMYSK